jgi:outer membrane receptor protein involved in Fe transport
MALGQDSTQHTVDLADASLEDLMNIEVYSASKHLQSAREAPAFVTVVTAEDIRNYGYRTLADILQAVPGFYVTYNRNYSFLGTQGFSRPGDYNSRVLLLVDGHRMNDAIYEYAMIGPELPLDVDLIERVEVIRGPGSSLYGTSAFFGVVNIITRRGRDVGTEISAEGASFGTGKGRVTYGHSFPGWEVLLSGSFYGSGGQTLYFPEFDSPLTNNGIARGLDDEGADDFLLKVSHGHFNFQGVYGIRDKGVPTASFGTIFGDPRERTTDERAYIDLGYERSFGPWNLASRVYLDHYRYNGTYPYAGGDGSSILNLDYALGQWWGSELKLSRTVHEKHLLTGGIEFRDNVHQDLRNLDLDPYVVNLHEDHSSSVWALYLQDEFAITRKLSLNLGVRYDHYPTLDGTNPRLGLIFRPWERTTLKLVVGQAFRAPNAYETYYAVPGQKLNPDLRAETIRTEEVVVEQWLGRRLRLSAAAHKNNIDGLISAAVDPNDGKTFLANNDSIRGQGVELQLDGKLNNGIEGRTSYSYEDDNTNGQLGNLPRHLAKLNLTVPLARRRLLAGWESQYTSSRTTLAGNQLGGFMLSNLTLSSRKLDRHIDLSLSLHNLFDKRYSVPGGYEHLQDALQQDGRSFRIKVGFKF